MFGDLRSRYFVSTLPAQPAVDLRDYIEPGTLLLHHRRVRFLRIKIHRMAMSRRSLGDRIDESKSRSYESARTFGCQHSPVSFDDSSRLQSSRWLRPAL